MPDFIQNIDFQILDWIRANCHTVIGDRVMVVISTLCDPLMWCFYLVALLLIKKTRKDGITATCGVLTGALIVNVILKNLVARSRPCWIRPDIPLLVSVPTDYSFPSGHTMATTVFTVIMVIRHPKLGFFLIPLDLLLMFSRMYLYVHFPSDVLFSLVAGTIVGITTCILEPKVSKKILTLKENRQKS